MGKKCINRNSNYNNLKLHSDGAAVSSGGKNMAMTAIHMLKPIEVCILIDI